VNVKRLHRKDLWSWSVFNERLNLDFNCFAWIRKDGNVLVDPLPMSEHDEKHLGSLGGASWIVLTNSDHVRGCEAIAKKFGAKIAGPAAEKAGFPIACDRWLADGESLVPGLVAYALDGSKTPGEIALVLEESTLIFGDLVRAHRAGSLMTLLPEQKLKDKTAALASIRRVAGSDRHVDAVLVGDGWCAFGDARVLLDDLLAVEEPIPPRSEDSGQFLIPQSRSSVPVPRAAAKCSFCERLATDHRLVSGTTAGFREPAAVCAPCAARLDPADLRAVCDFCQQQADVTARDKDVTICKECLDLALTIFGDAEA
jgi:glyoxylase-like metal-dependent hydrolase (beta-lactamase superfamily II)